MSEFTDFECVLNGYLGRGLHSRNDSRSLHSIILSAVATCGLWGCKNRPAPFPGRMSDKATKPGSVCPLS